jgi:hypothetical protein
MFLLIRQRQLEEPVVVIHHVQERFEAPIVIGGSVSTSTFRPNFSTAFGAIAAPTRRGSPAMAR